MLESCSYSYNQLNAIRKVLREKFGDERQEAMIDELGWVGQYIDQQENCIYVMLERCLDSDIAEFKRKVCDSPLIKFKVNAARKSKVDDNTAKMQSIKWLGV